MQPGNVIAASGRLQEAAQQLQLAWGTARDLWNDGAARRFEEDHLRPFFEAVNVALPALSQLAQAMQQAQTQCNEPGENRGL